MIVYENKDFVTLKSNLPKINKEIQAYELEYFEPNLLEMKKVYDVVIEFIKRKKRVIYGGSAINKLLIQKNKDAFIYDEHTIPDLDIYSPVPIDDLMELATIMHEKKFKEVIGRQAFHEATYSLFINMKNYCDFTYIPAYIYDHIPTISIDGIRYAHPIMITLDFYRIFTDPLLSYWRLEKVFERFMKLQTYYPFVEQNNYESNKSEFNFLDIVESILSIDTIILVGEGAYNYYMNFMNKKLIEPFLFEFISTNISSDARKIWKLLESKNFEYVERYPFFQYTDHSIVYTYNKKEVFVVYGNNEKCVPYVKMDYVFTSDKPTLVSKSARQRVKSSKTKSRSRSKTPKSKHHSARSKKPNVTITSQSDLKIKKLTDKTVKIGTFNLVILYFIIRLMYNYVNSLKYSNYEYFIYQLNKSRKEYFNKSSLEIINETVLTDFSTKCIGFTIKPDRKSRIIANLKYKNKQRPLFKFNPAEQNKFVNTYKFKNVSGNKILNNKNEILK